MGYDSRHLVLEFLAENRNLNIQQMTLVFFGKKSDPFLQVCLEEDIKDKVYVYHSKGTRLFWKEYGYEKLNGSIIELLFDTNAAMNISKNDVEFEITEPYYFLDLRKFDFEYLSLIPVIDNEELVGYALLYGYEVIEESKYPHISLRRLFRNIIKNEISAKYIELDNLLAGKIGYLDFNNNLYLSKKLAEILKVEQKVSEVNKIKDLYINANYRLINSYEINKYKLVELELDNRNLLALDELSKPKKVKEFTLLYILNNNNLLLKEMFKEITKVVDLIFPKESISFYKVNNNAIVVLINKRFLKKVIKQFKNKLKNYLIIDIRNNSDITPNANLKLVVDYIEEVKCLDFNYEEYKKFRLIKEESKYNNI